MSIEFAEVSAGGSYIKPEELRDAKALLLEVERFERQRPSKYGPKDTAVATITAFRDNQEPAVQAAVQIQQSILARDLQPLVGKATIVKLEQGKSSNGNNPPWVWRKVEDDIKAEVVAYVKEREAKIAAAADEAPDFD